MHVKGSHLVSTCNVLMGMQVVLKQAPTMVDTAPTYVTSASWDDAFKVCIEHCLRSTARLGRCSLLCDQAGSLTEPPPAQAAGAALSLVDAVVEASAARAAVPAATCSANTIVQSDHMRGPGVTAAVHEASRSRMWANCHTNTLLPMQGSELTAALNPLNTMYWS